MEVKKNTNIDEYIERFPEDVQAVLQTVRESIRKEIPQAEETISYGVPTFKLKGSYVVYFVGYKKHISIYPVFEALENEIPEIAKYKKGKETLQFPLDQPVPFPLIRKIAQALLNINIERTSKK